MESLFKKGKRTFRIGMDAGYEELRKGKESNKLCGYGGSGT